MTTLVSSPAFKMSRTQSVLVVNNATRLTHSPTKHQIKIEVKKRDQTFQWLIYLADALVQQKRNKQKTFLNRSSQEKQSINTPSSTFRRQSCCCIECGKESQFQRKIANTHTQSIIQYNWEKELKIIKHDRRRKSSKKKINTIAPALKLCVLPSPIESKDFMSIQGTNEHINRSVKSMESIPEMTSRKFIRNSNRIYTRKQIFVKQYIQDLLSPSPGTNTSSLEKLQQQMVDKLKQIINRTLEVKFVLGSKDDGDVIYKEYSTQLVMRDPRKRLSIRQQTQKFTKDSTMKQGIKSQASLDSDSSAFQSSSSIPFITTTPIKGYKVSSYYKKILTLDKAKSAERVVHLQVNKTVQQYVKKRHSQIGLPKIALYDKSNSPIQNKNKKIIKPNHDRFYSEIPEINPRLTIIDGRSDPNSPISNKYYNMKLNRQRLSSQISIAHQRIISQISMMGQCQSLRTTHQKPNIIHQLYKTDMQLSLDQLLRKSTKNKKK